MSNVLKVTSPMTNYENVNAVRSGQPKTADPSIQGQVNPEKVVKADARSDSAAQEQNVGLKYQFESNYSNFIQQLREMPSAAEMFSKVFFERFSTLAESGLGDDFAEQIGQLFSMVDIDAQDLLGFVKNQGNASIRFGGAFFSLLRQVMAQTNSIELKSGILEFLRRYTDMAEGPHIMQNVEQNLGTIRKGMFRNAGDQLAALAERLNYDAEAGSPEMENNTAVLKEQILPYINKYISNVHDRGGLRDAAAKLAAYIARSENGSAGRVTEAFDNLMQYQGMQRVFKGFQPPMLLQILENTEFEKITRQQSWMKKLAELIDSGVSGAAGNENRAIFKNLMQSILLNESVYMPVLHMMLPMQINGQLMFAEMWVDPDAQKQEETQEPQKKVIQGLLKFDIQDVGFFDLYFVYQDGTIRLQMNCPEKFKEQLETVRTDLAQIMVQNGLKAEEMYVETGQTSIPISEAFPKIFERKNSINVRV